MKSFLTLRVPLACTLAALFSGCAIGPDYVRPAVDLPAQYRDVRNAGTSSLGDQNWRSVFTDPTLQALIEEALKASPDALTAAARVREAEAQAGVSRADLFPSASIVLNTTAMEKRPGHRWTSSFLGGASISWEIDLWGRYRRADEAARAQLLATAEAQNAVTASLIGKVANYYFQLAALQETLQITRRTADNQRDALRLIRKMSAAGIYSAAEEKQQESALLTTEARLPSLRRQIVETENALSVLLGRQPGTIKIPATTKIDLPDLAPPGLPSRLLERRPDVREAEAGLISANAKVGEAKAMFFPSLSLTAILGGVSTSLHDVVQGKGGQVASLGPGLLQPLFAGGRLTFNRDAALARLDQALINYRKTVLGALGEVADNLTAYETGAELLEMQGKRVEVSAEALRLANLRFRAGTTSLIEVLDAQRQLFSAETDQTQAIQERRNALVRLYLALGGGWETDKPAPQLSQGEKPAAQ